MNTDIPKIKSTKSILVLLFLAFTLPALILLLLFMCYTLEKQKTEAIEKYQNQLNQYASLFEEKIERYTLFSTDLTGLDLNFKAFLYTKTKLDTHLVSYDIMHALRLMQSQEPVYGGFFLYKDEFSYYYPAYQIDYALNDQQKLKEFLINGSQNTDTFNTWIPFPFSDRTVLVYTTGLEGTIFSVMVDPSLSEFIQNPTTTQDDLRIFFASEEGDIYSTQTDIPSEIIDKWNSDRSQLISCSSGKYRILKYAFPNQKMFLCFMIPNKTIWSTLNPFQKFLVVAIILLFFLPPFIMLNLSHTFLTPLSKLEETMKNVGNGNLELRADENISIQELKDFSTIFNQMLDDIQRLKLKSYEDQLQAKQAQLQYLHLQIRPHFFLNCLKGINSMAEKKQCRQIEEIVLALSRYFRYIFRDIQKWSTLSEELHAVTSYIHLQQMNYSRLLRFDMDIAADTTDARILPWSLLTFIENSLKHAKRTAVLALRIKSSYTTVDGSRYLNILVSDDGGGFSEEALKQLNDLGDSGQLYNDYHVGISNIYYRMALAYQGKAMLLFYNQHEEACSELFIPCDQAGGGKESK